MSGSRSSFARSLLFLTMESRVPPSSSPTMTASEMTLPTWIAMVGAVWAEGGTVRKGSAGGAVSIVSKVSIASRVGHLEVEELEGHLHAHEAEDQRDGVS